MGLFPSFFGAGFECSTHQLRDRPRLDLLAATGHDRFLQADYARLLDYGIRTVREGIRWHLIESSPGHFDWSIGQDGRANCRPNGHSNHLGLDAFRLSG